jgi:hypothetical protein
MQTIFAHKPRMNDRKHVSRCKEVTVTNNKIAETVFALKQIEIPTLVSISKCDHATRLLLFSDYQGEVKK